MPAEGVPRRHVVVVERDVIVGMDLVEDLTDLGYRVSGPFISARDVAGILIDDRPDLAIVDVGLRDGTGPAAARAIGALRIPFVLFSAGNRHQHIDGEFKGIPWVEKPASTDQLLAALGEDPADRGSKDR